MRGGLERWKRGLGSHGVRQALGYAFDGTCDSHLDRPSGVDGLASYSGDGDVVRYTVSDGSIQADRLDPVTLEAWLNGDDPETGEHRGRHLDSPDADLVLDGTINAPKSFSLAVLIDEDLASEFEALQDRLRTRIILTWQRQLNARRGAGGRIREALHRVEVVELQHRRSRALDPHIHRHLWLNVKVQGQDGQWSNVDSRVAMKLHTVINAEGELAARTDPEWITALSRHGYTLNEDGEIAQLAHLVRPLSRRSTQIEANKATHLARWRAGHPGQEPSHDVLNRIDRWAWAADRPNKPHDLDETSWEDLTRDELLALDPTVLQPRAVIESARVPVADLDRDLLAARAVVDADQRSTGTGGRFSRYDILAGAMRAVAASGASEDRAMLQEVINDVAARALLDTVDVLHDEKDVPAHIKHLMSARTAALKLDLATRFDELNRPGVDIPPDAIQRLSAEVLENVKLDQGQADAAAVIGGTHRLVTVVGPAGSGKTTMLRVAHAALARQQRRMVVVAPTKKAATVAQREIGAEASSLHALLVDHGWRYGTDAAGNEVWTRLHPGDIDQATGITYNGPTRYPLAPGDRIVVDESGMVDLNTANALAQVAADTGAGLAMVGDDLQARPVGHSGAMACMARRSGAVVELSDVHRFHDPEYAALTLRMRQPAGVEEAAAVATELARTGHVRRVDSEDAAMEAMVDAYFEHAGAGRRVALVTATNAEADAVSEAIQHKRLELGQLRQDRVALGLGDQRILVGDIVQTRRNDRASGVENRATWTVARINATSVLLASTRDSGDVRTVTRDYVCEHVHLAYASTVHGIQGETTNFAAVGPGVDAAGLYVGMTRGRDENEVIVVARSEREARAEIAKCLLRGSIEATIDDSTQMAKAELRRAARESSNDNEALARNAAAMTRRGSFIGGIG
ncbi:hypothetical protein LK09_08230 [Microbacterium mangrovi]|uniref:TrwC relaxase domain-containing protein n=1 Tax=Microbacterium mangrovi TaxID=1348253 RepID=A0A0B2A6Y8_9MICO|nr:AAA family ATPase [Microbacterium mangrovi]KHK98845.1 hypothetical protein LK09_08230 [Microbacterium mangrovi]